jgi:DNA-binding NarL/FixJ family response regulator
MTDPGGPTAAPTNAHPADRPGQPLLRVLLVDDEALVRDGLQLILERVGGFTVVGHAADGAQAVRAAEAARPDVVLVDVRMPRVDGIAATRELVALDPAPQVIVLTTFGLDEYVFAALEAGAAGFLLKDTPPRDLATAIRTVANGASVLSPSVTRAVVDRFARQPTPGQHNHPIENIDQLTDRERDVLVAVASGSSNADIAKHLHLSEATVKTHISRLLAKLGLANRVQAAILAYRAGLLD